jgi:hypothetical protein
MSAAQPRHRPWYRSLLWIVPTAIAIWVLVGLILRAVPA